MAAEMADRVSSRRMVANGFFLTVNTALVSILGFLYSKTTSDKRPVLISISAAGIVVAVSWAMTIRSYKRLNNAKYSVIQDMEKTMAIKYFTDEWELLKTQQGDVVKVVGSRKRWLKAKDRYTELTDIEIVVPVLFGLIFLLMLLGAAFKVIIN